MVKVNARGKIEYSSCAYQIHPAEELRVQLARTDVVLVEEVRDHVWEAVDARAQLWNLCQVSESGNFGGYAFVYFARRDAADDAQGVPCNHAFHEASRHLANGLEALPAAATTLCEAIEEDGAVCTKVLQLSL